MVKNSVLLLLHPSKWHVEKREGLKRRNIITGLEVLWLLSAASGGWSRLLLLQYFSLQVYFYYLLLRLREDVLT